MDDRILDKIDKLIEKVAALEVYMQELKENSERLRKLEMELTGIHAKVSLAGAIFGFVAGVAVSVFDKFM